MKRFVLLWTLLLASPLLSAAEAPFLWQVQGSKTTHYLLGSVHLLPKSAYPLPAPMEAAYVGSKILVLESDLAELSSFSTRRKWQTAARAPKGLAAEISPELLQRLQRDGATLKLPVDRCDDVKAWFCAVTLELLSLQRSGIESDQGVDQFYFKRARKQKKTVRWLESPDDQLNIFAKMPDSLSATFLESTLTDLMLPGRSAEDLLQMWLTGDVAGFERSIETMRDEYPALYERVLGERNRAWLPQLLQLLDGSEPVLVVVGAAHLVGAEGLPAMLTARGLAVKQVGAAQP